MSQTPNYTQRNTVKFLSVFVALLWISFSSDADDVKKPNGPNETDSEKKQPDDQWTGDYQGEKVKLVLRKTNNGYQGMLWIDRDSFKISCQQDELGLRGSLLVPGNPAPFTARLDSSELVLRTGISTYKLKRSTGFRKDIFDGRFFGNRIAITLNYVNGSYVGGLNRNGKVYPVKGVAIENSFVGSISINNNKFPLKASIRADRMRLSFNAKEYELGRIAHNVTIRKTVLAEDEDVIGSSVVVSPNNHKVAYVSQPQSARHFNLNGIRGPGFLAINGITFSPDSKRYTYVAKRKNSYHLVIDGKIGLGHDQLGPGLALFSPNSKRMAYAGRLEGKSHVMLDGKVSESFDEVGGLVFSPESSRFAYVGRNGANWHVIIDGKKSQPYLSVRDRRVVFSLDGKRVAFAVADSSGETVILDGIKGEEHEAVADLQFSPDGKRFVYKAFNKEKNFLVLDGLKSKPFDRVIGATFSPDSKHLVFGVSRDVKQFFVIDGDEGPKYDQILPFVYSNNSKHNAYAAKINKSWHVVLNGINQFSFESVMGLTINPKGQLACFAKVDGHWRAVVNGNYSDPVDLVFAGGFSPRGENGVFAARREKKHSVVINGEGTPVQGKFLPGSRLVFDDENKFHTVVRDGNQFLRLDFAIGN